MRYAIVLVCALVLGALGATAGEQSPKSLDATIFSYDGQDFVRVKTTLRTEDGKPAVNTKLARDNPAFKALMQKRSWSGDAKIFGRSYDAHYAPLMSEDGQLTGALFVAVPR
jgi:methyl-accepting chemotaxis protein